MSSQCPTEAQIVYIRGIQKRLKLSNALLDNHCIARFGVPLASLDKRQASDLLDEIVEWKVIPAELQREAGQMDLFGAAS